MSLTISSKDWRAYIKRLAAMNDKASEKMSEYVKKNGFADMNALIEYAYGLATKYGEGAAALSAAMYDASAEKSGKSLAPALPADTASYAQVAKTVRGVANESQNPDAMGNAVGRLVKQAGADTSLKNALRDGAEFAWIPSGDTCAFCLTLASRGWQKASKNAIKGGHAEHIHPNCDCTYAIRFDKSSGVAGYDPERYRRAYDAAEGSTPQEKINAMRRENYAAHRDEINAQKREAYAERIENEDQNSELTQGEDRQIFHTYKDPMREKMGSAYESHPKEMEKIEKELGRKGVVVKARPGSMGYSPSLVEGKPGELIMDPDASYSAWLHELKHVEDDEASGWKGFRLLEDPENFAKLEDAAYNAEIDFAKKNGYTGIVRRLERLRFERRQEILGIQRYNKQSEE